jgi:ABC-type uncharacterized transport system permease subunit
VESGLVYRDGVPDVYWNVVRSLHPVVDLHGSDSEAAKEAKQILQNVIDTITKAYVAAYQNRVSISICSSFFPCIYEEMHMECNASHVYVLSESASQLF